MADKDKYGIPSGGNSGAYTIKWYGGNKLTLTWEELVASIALGGWPESKWAEAAATSAAESSRQPFIYNTYKKGHFGLFQISRSAWPDFFKPQGNQDDLAWLSPEENARQGYAIYQKQGWGAWQAHSNGAYAANLLAAKAAVNKVKKKGTGEKDLRSWYRDKTVKAMKDVISSDPDAGRIGGVMDSITGSAEDAVSGIADATGITAVSNVLTDAWEAITTPAFWMRVAYGTTGAILIVGGLMLIVRNSPMVKNTVATGQKVAEVIPMGKVATAAKSAVKGKKSA